MKSARLQWSMIAYQRQASLQRNMHSGRKIKKGRKSEWSHKEREFEQVTMLSQAYAECYKFNICLVFDLPKQFHARRALNCLSRKIASKRPLSFILLPSFLPFSNVFKIFFCISYRFYPSVHLSVGLYMSLFVRSSIHPSILTSIYSSIYLFIHSSLHPSIGSSPLALIHSLHMKASIHPCI